MLRRSGIISLHALVFVVALELSAWSLAAGVAPASKDIHVFKAGPGLNSFPSNVKDCGTLKPYDAGDFYYTNEGKVKLLRLPDEIAVQFSDKSGGAFLALSHLSREYSLSFADEFHPENIFVLKAQTTAWTSLSRIFTPLTEMGEVKRVYSVYSLSSDPSRIIAFDEVLVCLKKGASVKEFEKELAGLPAELASSLPLPNVYSVRILKPEKITALAASVALSSWQSVEWAEPNLIQQVAISSIPNDPMFPHQQGLNNTGQNGARPDADADAPLAWDTTSGSSAITIAILDDGVDTSHPDLSIQSGGYDFLDRDSNPDPEGTEGHGTGCAGVAAAVGNNSLNISGVAPKCKILPIRIFDDQGTTSEQILGDAIIYASQHADVLSNSWGLRTTSKYVSSAIDYATVNGRAGLGCAVFFATGNYASLWSSGGGRMRIPMSGLSGTYSFGFIYYKDETASRGKDFAAIDNVCLIGSNQYTHLWREDFEGTFPPSGWELWASTGAIPWYIDTKGALTGTGGTRSPHSGKIKNDQLTELRTPLMTITGTETLAFAFAISSEQFFDGLYVSLYDANGNYVQTWGSAYGSPLVSGEPTVLKKPMFPASYKNCISVGASTDCDLRSDYSLYSSTFDFVAPSNGGWNDTVTLDPVGSDGWTSTDYKYAFGGTSAACPLAAGIAALALSQNPNLGAGALRSVLHRSCDKIGPYPYKSGEKGTGGRNNYYGYGRLNAALALNPPLWQTPTRTPTCTKSPTPTRTPKVPTPTRTPTRTPTMRPH